MANISDKPLHTEDYPTKATRPHYSVLDKTKIKETYGIEIPYWMDSLVMVVEGEIVGTSSCCPSRLARMSGWGEIVSLYLLPRVQGMGYGKALLRAAVDALGAMGLRDVFLWVLEDNLRARRFYEHMGFFASGEHLDDVIGGAALREVQYRLCPDGAGDPGKARL